MMAVIKGAFGFVFICMLFIFQYLFAVTWISAVLFCSLYVMNLLTLFTFDSFMPSFYTLSAFVSTLYFSYICFNIVVALIAGTFELRNQLSKS